MTKEYLQKVKNITTKIKDLRLKLPDVTPEDVSILSDHLTEIDFSDVDENKVQELQTAFNELSAEVNQIMHQLDQYCEGIGGDVQSIENQVKAVKAYNKTQQAK